MRDNKDPQSAELHFTGGAWSAFIAGVRTGEFAPGRSA